jgi:hypothetical protein
MRGKLFMAQPHASTRSPVVPAVYCRTLFMAQPHASTRSPVVPAVNVAQTRYTLLFTALSVKIYSVFNADHNGRAV